MNAQNMPVMPISIGKTISRKATIYYSNQAPTTVSEIPFHPHVLQAPSSYMRRGEDMHTESETRWHGRPTPFTPQRDEMHQETEHADKAADEDEDATKETHSVSLTQDVYSMAILCSAGYCRDGIPEQVFSVSGLPEDIRARHEADGVFNANAPTLISESGPGLPRMSMISDAYIYFLTVVTFAIQAASLCYCLIDKTEPSKQPNCCTTLLDHPVNIGTPTRVGQWFAVIYSVLSLENIICIDTLAWLNTWVCAIKALFCGQCLAKKRPWQPTEYCYEYEDEGCKIGSGNLYAFAWKRVPLAFLFFTTLRIVIGGLTLVTSIVIVVQSDSVTGVFQNFAALTVIAALDNLVFVAGHQRFLGHRAQRLCAKCASVEFHAEDLWYAIILLRITILVGCLLPFFVVLANVTNSQIVGAHCPEVVINNGVEEMGGLNGLYRWDGTFSNARPVYRQVHPAEPSWNKFVLAHCGDTSAWIVMAFPEESTSFYSSDIQQYCKTMWIFSSEVDTSYYVFGNEHWVQFTTNFGLVPATEFDISCSKCEKDNEQIQCNRAGTCNDNQRCKCNPDSFGSVCTYSAPCFTVSVRFEPGAWLNDFVQNGPLNLTRIQGVYQIVQLPRCLGVSNIADCEDTSPNDFNPDSDLSYKVEWYRKQDKLVSSSLRPIYFNKATEHILFHDGSRWAIASANRLKLPVPRNEKVLQDFFERFHPYDEMEVMKMGVKVYSSQGITSASPEDSNVWNSLVYESITAQSPSVVTPLSLEVLCIKEDPVSEAFMGLENIADIFDPGIVATAQQDQLKPACTKTYSGLKECSILNGAKTAGKKERMSRLDAAMGPIYKSQLPILADSPTCNTAYNAFSCIVVAAGADAAPCDDSGQPLKPCYDLCIAYALACKATGATTDADAEHFCNYLVQQSLAAGKGKMCFGTAGAQGMIEASGATSLAVSSYITALASTVVALVLVTVG